ncbi:hypothetical protein A1O3_01257 [Capronia epimyces CBS 606.96]|uniref:SRR1-like domain-containing protein n=1 Tax=Capronia epimyces CBS 606.96 TaxID=1182542 RepID=W9YSQ5_9EURO|nr:uncharacterized protein A1O3_01257 [Capronia epimyces CBS 606.96]EXJ92705.1 hypothetical protein A1O3_01257 [Capronia epimyces CBS 606.96]
MPHTSRKKKAIHRKRKEVVDEEGWTRVTSTSSAPGVSPRPAAGVPEGIFQSSLGDRTVVKAQDAALRPMNPVKGTTVETMRVQYDKIEAKWLESDFCRTFREILRRSTAGAERTFSNCVVFGSGSFCGDEIHWIDRHESAFYQIAAFKTAADTIGQIQGHRPPSYAQEPYYNDLDAEFLASLNIHRVDHPKGFDLLDETSFVYSPAAEPEVELQIISHEPRVWLHRSLEHMVQSDERTTTDTGFTEDESKPNRNLTKSFKNTHDFSQLPPLDLKNFPFHGSVLWWRKTPDHEIQP